MDFTLESSGLFLSLWIGLGKKMHVVGYRRIQIELFTTFLHSRSCDQAHCRPRNRNNSSKPLPLHPSKLYFNHTPTHLNASHLTPSSPSAINSITLAFTPNLSNSPLFSGASLTRQATSLHAIASTCFSSSHFLLSISLSFLGSSPPLWSRMRRALSCQKALSLCGGDQVR